MKYLLDTNAVSIFLNGRSRELCKRIGLAAPGDFAMCSVVWAELYFGAKKSKAPDKTIARVIAFASRFPCLNFDQNSAYCYGDIRATLERTGNTIGPNDLMISAIALCHNLVVITNNTREFERVPSLQWEDWTVEAQP